MTSQKTVNRIQKAEEIVRKGKIERVVAGFAEGEQVIYLVKGSVDRKTGQENVYTVDIEQNNCTCPDYENHAKYGAFACKHILAAQIYVERIVKVEALEVIA